MLKRVLHRPWPLLVVVVAISVVRIAVHSSLPPDDALTSSFFQYRATFMKLEQTDDSGGGERLALMNRVGITETKPAWGARSARYYEVGTIFTDLDDYETLHTSKGYVYCEGAVDPIVETFAPAEVFQPRIEYKRLAGHWYLYCTWAISKPE